MSSEQEQEQLKAVQKYHDWIYGKYYGYKKYQIIDETFCNSIRKLWEIIELKEVKNPPKEEKELSISSMIAMRKRAMLFGYPKRNFCKKFILEDKLYTLIFNEKYNSPEYRWVLYKEFDQTELLLGSIISRIKNISNVSIVISGVPNSGKTEGAEMIIKFIQYQFKKIKKMNINLYTTFSLAETNSVIKKLKFGDVISQDEIPGLAGTGSRNIEKYRDNLLKSIRANQNSFIFVDPKEVRPDVVTFYLETAGKYKKERITRYILYIGTEHKLYGHIYIPLHEDEKFRKNYEKRKMKNIHEMINKAGFVGANIDINQLNRDIDLLSASCMEQGIIKKSEIKSDIPFIEEIQGDTNYIEVLVNRTYLNMKKILLNKKREERRIAEEQRIEEEQKVEEENINELIHGFEYEYSEDNVIDTIKKEKNWRDNERDFKIYLECKKQKKLSGGLTQKKVGESFGQTEYNTSIIIKKVRGEINYHKGKLLERQFFKYLEDRYPKCKVEWYGESGNPDIVIYNTENNGIIIYSLKNLKINKDKSYWIMKDAIKSELEFALKSLIEYESVVLYLVVLNNTINEVIIKEVDYKNPSNVKIY